MTFVFQSVAGWIRGWRVSEELTGSGHQYILFQLTNPKEVRPAAQSVRWNVKKLDKLVATLKEAAELLLLPAGTSSRKGVENLVERTMVLITRACDAPTPRKMLTQDEAPRTGELRIS